MSGAARGFGGMQSCSSSPRMKVMTPPMWSFETPPAKGTRPEKSSICLDAPRLMRKTAKGELAADLREAAKDGNITELIALLRMSSGDQPLVFGALRTGCAVTLQLLLAHGADPNTEFDGQTPLAAILAAAQTLSLGSGLWINEAAAVELVQVLLLGGASKEANE